MDLSFTEWTEDGRVLKWSLPRRIQEQLKKWKRSLLLV
jgi:hypothetical protein